MRWLRSLPLLLTAALAPAAWNNELLGRPFTTDPAMIPLTYGAVALLSLACFALLPAPPRPCPQRVASAPQTPRAR